MVFFFKKWLQNHPQFLLHFLIHIDVLMLCKKFELIPTSIFLSYGHFLKVANFWKKAKAIPTVFSENWLRNYLHFLLHFSDVLMLHKYTVIS